MLEEVKPVVNTEVPTAPKENVSSPEVKVEHEKIDVEKFKKLEENYNNVKTALSEEREEKKAKFAKFEQEINSLKANTSTFEKLANAFKEPEEEQRTEQVIMTAEQVEELWEKKEAEKRKEVERENRKNLITNEVKKMSEEWDGQNGKPKYNDDEILKWQTDNGKLHLSPSEAFREKHLKDIMDYEFSQRVKGSPTVQSAQVPGGAPASHEPTPSILKTDDDVLSAVREAITNASIQVNN